MLALGINRSTCTLPAGNRSSQARTAKGAPTGVAAAHALEVAEGGVAAPAVAELLVDHGNSEVLGAGHAVAGGIVLGHDRLRADREVEKKGRSEKMSLSIS